VSGKAGILGRLQARDSTSTPALLDVWRQIMADVSCGEHVLNEHFAQSRGGWVVANKNCIHFPRPPPENKHSGPDIEYISQQLAIVGAEYGFVMVFNRNTDGIGCSLRCVLLNFYIYITYLYTLFVALSIIRLV
jgi:hypothetical protein